MSRQKVNGNRIRSAGNPDDEPVLSEYPSCPPTPIINLSVSVGNGSGSSSSIYDNAIAPLVSSSPDKGYAYISRIKEEEDEGEEDEEDDEEEDTQDDEQDPEDEVQDDATDDKIPPHRNNGGFQVSFPLKLQRMLDKLEAEGSSDIISWLSHGRAFLVNSPEAFVEQLMPAHFNQTKYSSFQRQLHMYNFQRITAGRDKGAYHHAHFQRGKPHLCVRMVRTRVNGKGCRKPGNPSREPNLYSLEKLPPIAPGVIIVVPYGIAEGEDGESDSAGSS
jgi:hypothetical protein